MPTLRERLSVPGLLVLGIDDAPSYIHNFNFGDEDAELDVSWTDDEGQIYEESYALDEETPEVSVYRLEKINMQFPENDDTDTMTDDAMRALCEANGVRIVEAQEDEIRGMWDWLDSDGNACDQSFNTEREAMVNAILELGLE